WNREAKCSCCFQIDQHLEFARLFNRQVSGFRPFENLVHVLGSSSGKSGSKTRLNNATITVCVPQKQLPYEYRAGQIPTTFRAAPVAEASPPIFTTRPPKESHPKQFLHIADGCEALLPSHR